MLAESVEVRSDHFDGEPDLHEGAGRPVGDDLLRPGDAPDPDEGLEIVDQPVAVDLSHEGSGGSCTWDHPSR